MSDVLERLGAALAEHYAIERQVGAGGMATVYLARDLKHDRAVALKVLRPELAAVLGIERFWSEIRVTAHLQHPHILPLFDSGQAGGLIYYVMPYVESESLRQRLEREKQLPIDEAVSLTANVAAALDYAHRHGVIHRDIKPENILFQDGQAVVAGLRIAPAVSARLGRGPGDHRAGRGCVSSGARRSTRHAGCRALGGRRTCDQPRPLGLGSSATRATRPAGGSVHAGPAAECTHVGLRGGPERGVVPGRVADHLCQLHIHRQPAVQPEARRAGTSVPPRHAERAEPVLLAGRTLGGVLLGFEAVQAAAWWRC